MKKTLLSILFLIGSITISTAQHFRIEAGVNTNDLTAKKLEGIFNQKFQDMPLRATLGLELNFTDFLYMSTEATFSKNTASVTSLVDKNIPEAFSKLKEKAQEVADKNGAKLLPYFYSTSIKVPLNLGVRMQMNESFALCAEGGAYAMFGLGSELGYSGSEKINLNDLKIDAIQKDIVKKMLLGLNASVAVEVAKFYLKVGAEYDLTDKVDLKKSIEDNFNNVKPTVEEFNKNRLNFYTTIGIRF